MRPSLTARHPKGLGGREASWEYGTPQPFFGGLHALGARPDTEPITLALPPKSARGLAPTTSLLARRGSIRICFFLVTVPERKSSEAK
jgi:hypothetical protein